MDRSLLLLSVASLFSYGAALTCPPLPPVSKLPAGFTPKAFDEDVTRGRVWCGGVVFVQYDVGGEIFRTLDTDNEFICEPATKKMSTSSSVYKRMPIAATCASGPNGPVGKGYCQVVLQSVEDGSQALVISSGQPCPPTKTMMLREDDSLVKSFTCGNQLPDKTTTPYQLVLLDGTSINKTYTTLNQFQVACVLLPTPPTTTSTTTPATTTTREAFCGVKDTCDKSTTTCVELAAGYRCDCLSGLLKVPVNDKKCEDRNECKDGSHNCALDGSELCTNTYRNFSCNCSNGYTRDTKTNKCLPTGSCTAAEADKAFCGPYSFCVKAPGTAPKCICETGYYFDEVNKVCDVVPCKNAFDCPSNSRCHVSQPQNKTAGVGAYKCLCDKGYEMKNHQCFPTEPCKTANLCGAGAVCVATQQPPFYECKCAPGANNATCTPLTCATSTLCAARATCKAGQNGGISCQCEPGHIGPGTVADSCNWINICTLLKPCSRYATCIEDEDSYTCECYAGYTGNGTWCANTNECSNRDRNNCDSHATCTDTQGSYECTCNPGYTGNGYGEGSCDNINECEDPKANNCDVNAICSDTIGAYKCACNAGYTGTGMKGQCTVIPTTTSTTTTTTTTTTPKPRTTSTTQEPVKEITPYLLTDILQIITGSNISRNDANYPYFFKVVEELNVNKFNETTRIHKVKLALTECKRAQDEKKIILPNECPIRPDPVYHQPIYIHLNVTRYNLTNTIRYESNTYDPNTPSSTPKP